MTITITDTAWGINRITGDRSETVVDQKTMPAVVGSLDPIGPIRKVFEITDMRNDMLTVVLNPAGKTVTLAIGETYIYRPRAFDGGHFYTITVQ